MNEHDEIDTVRREFGALAGKVRDAGLSAARWNAARIQQADRARDRNVRSYDRAVARAERAMRLAERGQRYLHSQWRAADRAAATDLAVDLEAARATRAAQEQLVAQWAWAHAHAGENPEAARDLDNRLLAETGIDPAVLRDPFAAASQRTQPFTPVDFTEATESARLQHDPEARVTVVPNDAAAEIGDRTGLDGDALIRGLIQAAHPAAGTNNPGLSTPIAPAGEINEQLGHNLSNSDIAPGV